jgi:Kef-type K+ transport system membrane component KefB
MRKVLLYSLLLTTGLVVSQLRDGAGEEAIKLLTMVALSFIMIHVGYEFDVDKAHPGRYLWDYAVAGTAAAFPWILCALYFVYVMAPPASWSSADLWKESLLQARFASPTSAGVLFAMLAAAGLGATWVFQKARVLAIFDDLDTILLMIPLKVMMVGMKWQLAAIVVVIAVLLWLAWRWLHRVRLPTAWPYVLAYATAIALACEAVYLGSKVIAEDVPVHLEVLLPAFVLGCVLARPSGQDPHVDDAREGVEQGPEAPGEQRVSTIVSACFMVLVGLSMPPIFGDPAPAKSALAYADVAPEVLAAKNGFSGWGVIALHVLAITLLANVGKMFPTFCYRREATLAERLALSIAMFPRGEVGAGVLVVSLSYGLAGPSLTVAILSLALNLLCTGLFIVAVKALLARAHRSA